MADEKNIDKKAVTEFRTNRVAKIKNIYSDETATNRRYDRTTRNVNITTKTAAEVRKILDKSLTDREQVVEISKKLFAINPIYSAVINYLANMYMWRYKVIPHKVYTKSKAKQKKTLKQDDFQMMYNQMLEVVDGLSIETKFPSLLATLFVQGSVYFTTYCDEDSITIDTILLPDEYCRKVGETQYGTAIIEFDMAYFDSLALSKEDLTDYFKDFPKEFQKGYNSYKTKGTDFEWYQLDPHYSSGILLNEFSIPTYLYILGGILDYEKYQDNELERNENMLKYLVVQKMPIYQDQMVFEMDEVEALHKSMKKIVDRGDKTRLLTTFGDVQLLKVAENDTAENQVLSKAFKAIFNNAGFNSGIFTSDSVEALKMSLIRDKGMVWRYINALTSFYSIAINNWYDFGSYQADIDILPISPYTYNDDIKVYKDNATLGVGKLDYIIASGIKQKNITDNFQLEAFLKLDQITPMQTSYTQTADDREQEESKDDNKEDDKKSSKKPEIEPSDDKGDSESSKTDEE